MPTEVDWDTTSDFYSELMFIVLSYNIGYRVSLNKKNDFIIYSDIAEVKSIHDKFDNSLLDQNRPIKFMNR